jgi:NAD(P)-dependent dehydrogenase (short-subunit alcohol dehydrogenase family)
MGRLDGQVALVVGASRGIGAEIARAFAREGARVGLCARSVAPLEALADELRESGAEAAAFGCDAADSDAVTATVAAAGERLGAADILVYAAGAAAVGRFEDIDDADWQRLYEVNVMGSVRFSRALLAGMRERGRGRIINVASTAAKYGSLYQSPYNASKHALLGLTRCLALETAADGITVNAICPGYVDTEMLREAVPEWSALIGLPEEELLDSLVATKVPQKRLLEPGEVAELALYVASPGAAGLTGQGLTLAGGLILI